MRSGRGSTCHPPVRQEGVAAVHAAHDGGQHRVDVEWRRRVCVFNCERVQEVLQAKQGMCSKRDERRNMFGGTKERMCLERYTGRDVFGKGRKKECVHKGTTEGMCSERDTRRGVFPF